VGRDEDDVQERVIGGILEVSRQIISDFTNDGPAPETLFHFTDAEGVLGIIRTKSLRASSLLVLNDASEVRHGIDIARECLQLRLKEVEGDPHRRMLCERTLQVLNPEGVGTDHKITFRHFAVSLCQRDDQSAHWLHYGRSGDGYAVGLQRSSLVVPPFELARVVYNREEQRAMVRRAVEKVEQNFVTETANIDRRYLQATCEASAHMFSNTMWALAGRFKNPSFSCEEEWRLLTLNASGPHVDKGLGTPMTTEFRASDNRIVPFFSVKYDGTEHQRVPISCIRVGARLDFAAAREVCRKPSVSTGTMRRFR
jgi:hypothetical protein